MGINDEYSRDAYIFEQVWDSDSDDDELTYDIEDWIAMNSDELLDAWMYIREYIDSNYIRTSVKYPDFVDLVVTPGTWVGSIEPTVEQRNIWRNISRSKIVKDHVSPDNFISWYNYHIVE